MREDNGYAELGQSTTGNPVFNHVNYPSTHVEVATADWIFEILES